ncbi:MAG: T9SS type A sorting domain-containing protein, partial [Ginsengibacter sp.]
GRIIYSTNNGAAWQLLHQFNHPVFWLATDPNNANRMYAGVINYSGGTGQGGIWITNNLNNLGNSTWTRLSNPPRTEGHPAAIVVLNDGKMVCTFSGRRNSGGAFTASSGVFIYDPNGNSWTDVSDANMQYWTKDIIIDPSDPAQNTWYVCVFSGWGGAPNGLGGLFKSVNRGVSWVKLTGTQFDRVTSITFNPSVVNQAYLTTETQGLWISGNMNAAVPSWSLVSSYPFRQPERVFFNPYNPNEVWVTSFGNGLKMGLQFGTLPLKLISFSGSRKNEITELKWTTANEDHGDIFEIERSTDGMNFTKAANKAGDGKAFNQYRYTDIISAPVLYYRVKVNGVAGNQYSNIITFKDKNSLLNDVQLMENPVKGIMRLQVITQHAGELQLILTDLTGKPYVDRNIDVNAGINQMNISIPSNFANGIYILKVKGENLKKNLRVVMLK